MITNQCFINRFGVYLDLSEFMLIGSFDPSDVSFDVLDECLKHAHRATVS